MSISRRRFIHSLVAIPPALSFRRTFALSPASRLALVIGNSAYQGAPLLNPANDAKAVGDLLSLAGFAVDSHLNAKRGDMMAAIERFAAAAKRSEVKLVVFYYAGHGAQLDWRNYLLPVDAVVSKPSDISQQCVDLNVFLGQLSAATGKTFIIILDACRNNPFGSSYRPKEKGLSQFDAPSGSLLAYATSPGNVASDGEGANGLYTENLVREMGRRGTRIEDALKRVRLNVRLASQGQQIPWETTSLEDDVFLFDEVKKKLSEAEIEQQVEADIAEWTRIKSSQKESDWVGYLRQFPNGRFAEIAQMRLTRLLMESEKAKSSLPQQGPSLDQQTARLEQERRKLEEQQRLEEKQRYEEQQRLDALRQKELEKIEVERQRIAEAARASEAQRKLEEQRLAEEQKKLDLERQRVAEAERLASEQKKRDEQRLLDEQQRARLELEWKQKEEQSIREKQARLKEQQRIEMERAELERKQALEAQRLITERQHLAEEQRRQAEQQRLDSIRQQDEQRIAEAARLANEKQLAEVEKQRREKKIMGEEKSSATMPVPLSSKPAIEIRAGLPVPILIAASINPYSSGRYPLGRQFTVGDEFGLIEYDLLTMIEKPALLRVTSIDSAADRVVLNDGAYIWDMMGNVIRSPSMRSSDVPRQGSPVELQIGKKWSAGWTIDHPKFGKVIVDRAYHIIAYETVEVPAGKFSAFVVSFQGFDSAGRRAEGKKWIVPGLNVSVKEEILQTRGAGRGFNSTDGFKLASIRQYATGLA